MGGDYCLSRMGKIGIIDADLLNRKGHRFPNLACMKLSGFWKSKGEEVSLLLNYFDGNVYDHVYVSKVFTSTEVPFWLKSSDTITFGGTGFYFDKATPLPYDIEHTMPDYHLYDAFVNQRIQAGESKAQFKEYLNNSIGFLTRGCFRRCPFCVNQNETCVRVHSSLEEFLDSGRPEICMLDDNFLGFSGWKPILQQLIDTGIPFKFKQGLDERILTEEKCEMLFAAKYSGDYIFAFDNVSDYDLIELKLKMIRRYTETKSVKFYVLVGFESTDAKDIENMFRRIELLMRYACLPYIMRYAGVSSAPWAESKYRELYTSVARWCNQPALFKKLTFREFCNKDQVGRMSVCSSMRAMTAFEKEYPEIARQYFDLRFS